MGGLSRADGWLLWQLDLGLRCISTPYNSWQDIQLLEKLFYCLLLLALVENTWGKRLFVCLCLLEKKKGIICRILIRLVFGRKLMNVWLLLQRISMFVWRVPWILITSSRSVIIPKKLVSPSMGGFSLVLVRTNSFSLSYFSCRIARIKNPTHLNRKRTKKKNQTKNPVFPPAHLVRSEICADGGFGAHSSCKSYSAENRHPSRCHFGD